MYQLDLASRVPIYEQVCNNIITLAATGVIKPGDRLPTVRAAADQLGINPNTVAKAYRDLEAKGYIYSRVGRGSFLTDKLSKDSSERLLAVSELRGAIKKARLFGVTKEEIFNIAEEECNGGNVID